MQFGCSGAVRQFYKIGKKKRSDAETFIPDFHVYIAHG